MREVVLDDSGLSLWLTDRKAYEGPWVGRSLLALVGDRVAGELAFALHPDGQALSVEALTVMFGFKRRGLASALMDALYAAHPTTWINHGARTPDGARWWNDYTDPAPERNVHNVAPSRWATYFNATKIGGQKSLNAYLNATLGLDGHRGAEYRYHERSEAEAEQWAPAFREVRMPGLDPRRQDLYAGVSLFLASDTYRWTLDASVDAAERASYLLDHIGLGNLPRRDPGFWNSTAQAAFEDTALQEAWHGPVLQAPLQVVLHILPLSSDQAVSHEARSEFVAFTELSDICVRVAGVSWRTSDRPWDLHTATLTPAVEAAIGPLSPRHATANYTARYDEVGDLRPEHDPARRIPDLASKLIRDSLARTAAAPPRQDPVSPGTAAEPLSPAPPAGDQPAPRPVLPHRTPRPGR